MTVITISPAIMETIIAADEADVPADPFVVVGGRFVIRGSEIGWPAWRRSVDQAVTVDDGGICHMESEPDSRKLPRDAQRIPGGLPIIPVRDLIALYGGGVRVPAQYDAAHYDQVGAWRRDVTR